MNLIKKDRRRYFRPGNAAYIKGIFNPCFRFVVLMRICQSTSKINPFGLCCRWWFKGMQRRYGFQIPHTTRIGGGLFFSHYGNIVINGKSIIGEDCNIAQGVTIGKVNRGNKVGFPTIGNRVWIGANSVIVGGISIGNNAMIAPLSFVNFDVPDNAVVMGSPGKIVSDKGSQGYINFFD